MGHLHRRAGRKRSKFWPRNWEPQRLSLDETEAPPEIAPPTPPVVGRATGRRCPSCKHRYQVVRGRCRITLLRPLVRKFRCGVCEHKFHELNVDGLAVLGLALTIAAILSWYWLQHGSDLPQPLTNWQASN